MSSNYGYFHDLLIVDGFRRPQSCRLDFSRPPSGAEGDTVYGAAGNIVGMLEVHLRRLSEVLNHALDTDEPVPPSREALRDIMWSMSELSGLLEVMRNIEEHSRGVSKHPKVQSV